MNRFLGFLGDGTIDDVEVEDFMAYSSLWPIFQASRHQGYDLDKLETVKSFLRARDIENVKIIEDRETELFMLFDPETNLEEKILEEQFTYS